jgi:regulator of protease activity HflC (stomatin/prohibitin superfamily)
MGLAAGAPVGATGGVSCDTLVALTLPNKSAMKTNKRLYFAGQLALILLLVAILFSPFTTVSAGERGVLMEFGKVQERVLGEGIHFIVPIVNTVIKLSVRVQKQQISAEASSKDLQDIFSDVALNWHIIPEEVNVIFQEIGDEPAIVERIINPAVEEVLKAVIAKYTAEEIITRREEVKLGIDNSLTSRLANYHIAVDDISLVDVHFSPRFNEAVEAKQIAEQEAKRAEFIALKASKEAEAKINLAKGEAEAERLLRETLTAELLQKQAIDKWNGNLPLFVGNHSLNFLEESDSHKPER